MAYTTINKSSDHFNTKLYTGNGGSLAVTGVGFQPDWLWIKQRNTTRSHQLMDSIRGASYRLHSDQSVAQSASALTSFDSDGFTVDGTSLNGTNQSSGTYASWNWKANGAGSSNTDGDITSTVSANTTAGFSIVQYQGNGSASNIGHGLGSAPKVVLIKKTSGSTDWLMGHQGLHASTPWKYGMNLNGTDARHESGTYFADTAPTTSVFRVEANSEVNSNGDTYIAYCFAERTGFSKFGEWEGNSNANGPFIYTGFKPAWILVKKYYGTTGGSGSGDNWEIIDTTRDTFNVSKKRLFPNANSAESNNDSIDIVSNGFKVRTSSGGWNEANNNYIFMAFAEAPLVGSNNVPCTAR